MALDLVELCSTSLSLNHLLARATQVCGDGIALLSGGEVCVCVTGCRACRSSLVAYWGPCLQLPTCVLGSVPAVTRLQIIFCVGRYMCWAYCMIGTTYTHVKGMELQCCSWHTNAHPGSAHRAGRCSCRVDYHCKHEMLWPVVITG